MNAPLELDLVVVWILKATALVEHCKCVHEKPDHLVAVEKGLKCHPVSADDSNAVSYPSVAGSLLFG
jgi:hypothetical protein